MTNTPFRPFETTLDSGSALQLLRQTVDGGHDGEIFLERKRAETLIFDDGNLKNASFDASEGFGLRAIRAETAAYAHSSEISMAALQRASETARLAIGSGGGTLADAPTKTNQRLYTDADPITDAPFALKVETLKEIDDFTRSLDKRVVQVSATLGASLQEVEILRPEGDILRDIRPMTVLFVSVTVEKDGRREAGSHGSGGRTEIGLLLKPAHWKSAAREALRIALVNLEAQDAPAGIMDVALGNGWPGILLHEAIGHGLEGDFNRKKTSAFAGLMGKQVAAKGVTVVDDGTIPDRRGSISFDDEGTPSQRNVLIEDGILVGYMQDRQNARLMDVPATGNGRRQSYAHAPMPRMTNTIMESGDATPEDVIKEIKDGIYAVNFSGGQVDITNGKFVFSCTEAYKVENGKIKYPVKGATLIGDGPSVLRQVRAIGNDSKMDPGIGSCGKAGQTVPVGVGQPTLLIGGLTVGGSAG
ncbi:MAG: metallopeptidase TldD-related protein [Rhodobacteraceae bacterium]|nr:metallopeptidase TldD-related protein [Paracoccaceae bacterium]